MTDAIRRAVASPPAWDDVQQAQSLTGLRRRHLAPLDVLAPSLAAAKPAATALVVPVVLTGYVGSGAWLSVLVAVLGALLLRSVIGEFTSRIVTSGSLYTFVVRGLGAWAGLVTAVAMMLAYGFASSYALTSSGLAARAVMAQDSGASSSFGPADTALVLLVGLGCGLVLMRRVSTFTTVTLAIEIVTTIAVLVLVVLVIADDRPMAHALSLADADPARIAGGATVMLAMLVGFECSASHGAEAARPFRTVPRAMIWSILIAGALCLVTTLALGADSATSLDALHRSIRVEQVWFPGGNGVLDVFRLTRILSLVACTLAVWSAMTRLVYTLALEGVLPCWLARTHPRLHTPSFAVLATAPIAIGPGTILVATNQSLQTVAASLLDSTGLLMLIAYLMVCVAVPAFLFRIGELTARTAATATLAGGMVVLAIVKNLSWQEQRDDADFVWILAALVVPLATLWYLNLRRQPAVLDATGMHDETIEADAWVRPTGEGAPR